jgi:hypothetical protein
MPVIDDAMLALRRDYFAQHRHALAGIGEDAADSFDSIGLDDRDHSDPAIERTQQLKLSDVALFRQPFEDRQYRQTREINSDAQMLRQHTGNVVGESTAGDMGERFDGAGFTDRAQGRFDVQLGRGQQRAAERHDRRKRRRRIKTKTRGFDDPSYQGKAVGMNAGRSEAKHGIAGANIRTRQ